LKKEKEALEAKKGSYNASWKKLTPEWRPRPRRELKKWLRSSIRAIGGDMRTAHNSF